MNPKRDSLLFFSPRCKIRVGRPPKRISKCATTCSKGEKTSLCLTHTNDSFFLLPQAVAFNRDLASRIKTLEAGHEPSNAELREMYLSLLANSLLGLTAPNNEYSLVLHQGSRLKAVPLDRAMREKGGDLPFVGVSASGRSNLRWITENIIAPLQQGGRGDHKSDDSSQAETKGDFVSCAPFRGGTGVYLRQALDSYMQFDRAVVIAAEFGTKQAEDVLQNSKRGSPVLVDDQSQFLGDSGEVVEYLRRWSTSRREISENIVNHLLITPDDSLMVLLNISSAGNGEADVSSSSSSSDSDEEAPLTSGVAPLPVVSDVSSRYGSQNRIRFLHIGAAGEEEVSRCLALFSPLLEEHGKVSVAVDKCFGCSDLGRLVKDAIARDGASVNVHHLESGGVVVQRGEFKSSRDLRRVVVPNLYARYVDLLKVGCMRSGCRV